MRHTKRLKQTKQTNEKKKKKKNPEFEETKQASEPDSDMAGMLELSDQDFFLKLKPKDFKWKSRQHARTDDRNDNF